MQYLDKINLQDKEFLELGCGSGLISIVAAKKAAKVTASDINQIATRFLKKNSHQNKVSLNIIHSDLFTDIPLQKFDVIAINPPYYKKKPVTLKDHAWYCGENGEYFSRLFEAIGKYIHSDTEILMVLFDGCDMEMINGFAVRNGFRLTCVYSKQNLLEKNLVFKIEKQA